MNAQPEQENVTPQHAPARPPQVPFEDSAAAYIVGKLALMGWLHPEGYGEMSEVTAHVSEWLMETLRFAGWEGGLDELVNAGDLYQMMQKRQGQS